MLLRMLSWISRGSSVAEHANSKACYSSVKAAAKAIFGFYGNLLPKGLRLATLLSCDGPPEFSRALIISLNIKTRVTHTCFDGRMRVYVCSHVCMYGCMQVYRIDGCSMGIRCMLKRGRRFAHASTHINALTCLRANIAQAYMHTRRYTARIHYSSACGVRDVRVYKPVYVFYQSVHT